MCNKYSEEAGHSTVQLCAPSLGQARFLTINTVRNLATVDPQDECGLNE